MDKCVRVWEYIIFYVENYYYSIMYIVDKKTVYETPNKLDLIF